MKLQRRLLAAAVVALACLLGLLAQGGDGAAPRAGPPPITILTDCVDKARVANLNQELETHGGPKAKTRVCNALPGVNLLRAHTSICPLHTEKRGCYQMDPTSNEFEAAGCGIFTEVSATNKATEEAIIAALTAAVPNNLRRGLGHAEVTKIIKVYSNQVLQGLSVMAAVLKPAPALVGLRKSDGKKDATPSHEERVGTAAMISFQKYMGIPYKFKEKARDNDPDANKVFKFLTENFEHIVKGLVLGTMPAPHKTFFEDHVDTAAAKRALTCLPILHPQIGLGGGRINNDVPRGCTFSTKKFDVHPACTRLAVAQLLNFNRHPQFDTTAPWKLGGGWGTARSNTRAIAHNIENTFMKAYKSDNIFRRCTVKEHFKTTTITCQTFTECNHNVMWHVGKEYSSCNYGKNVLEEDTAANVEQEEQEGLEPVMEDQAPGVGNGGLTTNKV